MAIPLTLLLLLALTGLAHGALILTRQQVLAAHASARYLQASLAAEGGVREVLRGWVAGSIAIPTRPAESRILRSRLPGGARYEVVIRRLSSEIVLLDAVGQSATAPGERRIARVVWSLDPRRRVREFRAALEYGQDAVAVEGTLLNGGLVTSPPPHWDPVVCAPYALPLVQLYPTGSVADALYRAELSADAGDVGAGSSHPPALEVGPLDLGALRRRSDVFLGGSSTTTLTMSGGCDPGSPRDWGSPLEPMGICGNHFPLVTSTSGLALDGAGQGVLLVLGDLELASGASFYGVALVAGDLTLRTGARISGFARVGGRAILEEGAGVVASGCVGLRAFDLSRGLKAPLPVPGGSWLAPA
jgi:hypothetical protein